MMLQLSERSTDIDLVREAVHQKRSLRASQRAEHRQPGQARRTSSRGSLRSGGGHQVGADIVSKYLLYKGGNKNLLQFSRYSETNIALSLLIQCAFTLKDTAATPAFWIFDFQ